MALHRYTPQQLSRTADHWRIREPLAASSSDEDRDPFVLDPPYQRQSVWTDAQRVNLIRSLIMGLPVGSVWTNDRGYPDNYAVIDGKQRIETIRAWFDGELAVPAAWFEPRCLPDHLADDPGEATITYPELSEGGQRFSHHWHIGELMVRGLTIEQEAELYLLVNFGGVEQTDADRDRATAVANAETG